MARRDRKQSCPIVRIRKSLPRSFALQVTETLFALSTCRAPESLQSEAARAPPFLPLDDLNLPRDDGVQNVPNLSIKLVAFSKLEWAISICSRRGDSGAAEPEIGKSAQTRIEGWLCVGTLGHTISPRSSREKTRNPAAELRELGLARDLYSVSSKFSCTSQVRLRENYRGARMLYAGTIGAEFQHIRPGHSYWSCIGRTRPAKRALPGSADRSARSSRRRRSKLFCTLVRGAKTFSPQGASRYGDLDSIATLPAEGSRKFAWEWRTAAGSMSWRIS